MSVPKFGRVGIPPAVGMTGVENTIQNILFGTKEGGKWHRKYCIQKNRGSKCHSEGSEESQKIKNTILISARVFSPPLESQYSVFEIIKYSLEKEFFCNKSQ